MPLVLTDTAKMVVDDYIVRKPLRERITVTEVTVATTAVEEQQEETGTVRAHVINISPKKVTSSYRQDLLTSQK